VSYAPLDDTGAQLLFRFLAAAYERRALGIGSHWPFQSWGGFLPEHTTAVSMLDCLLHHANVIDHRRRLLPHARSLSTRRCPPEEELINREGFGSLLGHQRGPQLGH
jgi:hypothetical protein